MINPSEYLGEGADDTRNQKLEKVVTTKNGLTMYRPLADLDKKDIAKIGEEKFLETDEYIKTAYKYGLCKELVLNDPNFEDKLLESIEEETKRLTDLLNEEKEKSLSFYLIFLFCLFINTFTNIRSISKITLSKVYPNFYNSSNQHIH